MIAYLLWSNKHAMWWRPNALGYTNDITEAGRYGVRQAIGHVVQSANHGRVEAVTCMVAAPENYMPVAAAALTPDSPELDAPLLDDGLARQTIADIGAAETGEPGPDDTVWAGHHNGDHLMCGAWCKLRGIVIVKPAEPVRVSDERVEGEVQCGAVAESCVCVLAPHGPEVAHTCDVNVCGGQWRGDLGGDDFEVVRFPRFGGVR